VAANKMNGNGSCANGQAVRGQVHWRWAKQKVERHVPTVTGLQPA